MSDYRMLYVTAASREQALVIAHALVEARLAACANIIDGITSVYRWQGKVQQDSEAAMIIKTRAELVEAVIEKVKALHSYSVPCVVSLPILAGNPAFLEWIGEETKISCK